jgi:hypothetical protein
MNQLTHLLKTPCVLLFLAAIQARGQAFRVATVGDSFADSLYNSIRARPDLVASHGIRLMRWSRPIVGLTRTDYFDYAAWLQDLPSDLPDSASADLCFVEIGTNDMQSISVAPQQWIAYGSAEWREAYAKRTGDMARLLLDERCGQVLWVLQPGFEKRDGLACHRELVNEIQRETLRLDRARLLDVATTDAVYGADKTHFNRAFLLQLGPAMFQLIDTARQIDNGKCYACHRNVDLRPTADIAPLRWVEQEPLAPVWAPERTGVLCRVPVVRTRVVRPRPRVRRRRRRA